jgi:hypothetical protein
VRAPDDRRAAGASCRRRGSSHRYRGREQRVELLQTLVERDQLVAPLDEQVLAELVAAKHLEHQPTEIAQALLAHTQERAALAAELAGMGEGAARRALRPRARGSASALAAEACEQRRPRHDKSI